MHGCRVSTVGHVEIPIVIPLLKILFGALHRLRTAAFWITHIAKAQKRTFILKAHRLECEVKFCE